VAERRAARRAARRHGGAGVFVVRGERGAGVLRAPAAPPAAPP
jgi:hypothetical protein